MKSEWGGSKLPAIEVSKPKGTSGKKEGNTHKEELQEPVIQGSKRIRDKEVNEEKIQRTKETPEKKKKGTEYRRNADKVETETNIPGPRK